jgi:hypothetical protein
MTTTTTKDLWIFAPIAIGVILFGAMFLVLVKQDKRTVRYNCDLSEISPDFPKEVKEECRKLRSGRI